MEEKEHAQVAEGTEGYNDTIMNAGKIIACFKGKLKHVKCKFKLNQQRVMLNPPVLNPSPFDQSNVHSNLSSQSVLDGSLSQRNSVKVNLPKIQLPCFDGNIQQWTEFWEMFTTSVDQQNLSKVSKFTLLKGVLRGAAAAAVSGIAITNDNYDLAVILLKERFGRVDVIIESLYIKLQGLPRSVNKFTEIHKTQEQIENILRQLELQGEVVNNQIILIQLVLSKFPLEVVIKLEESKPPTERWNMENLRKAILKYVRVQENVFRYTYNTKGQLQVQGDNNKGWGIGQRSVYCPTNKETGYQSQTTTAEVFASFSGKGNSQRVMQP